MNLFRNIHVARLWSRIQFVLLALAMVVPLFSSLSGRRPKAETSLALSASSVVPERSPPSKILSSGVVSLPEVNVYPRVTLFSQSRQIRFERIAPLEGRGPASVGPSYKLVKIRQKLLNGEYEELPLIMNGIGKRQPIGSVYVELGNRENVFLADYMDKQGKMLSQEIRIKRASGDQKE